MTELQRYLAEEVAEDHADGIITRREAVRRLGLLGVTGSAAIGLLGAAAERGGGAKRHACEERTGRGRARGAQRQGRRVGAAATTPITFAGPRGHAHGRLGAGRRQAHAAPSSSSTRTAA